MTLTLSRLAWGPVSPEEAPYKFLITATIAATVIVTIVYFISSEEVISVF